MRNLTLRGRSNINKKNTKHSDVYIYEDHRTILNVLFTLKKQKKLDASIDIFMFDDHDDAVHLSKEIVEIAQEYAIELPSYEDFWMFTEFKLRGMDDDWVIAGMELGLINNVFLFNSSKSSISFLEEYQTREFGIKKIYNLGDVWDALSYKGYLEDIVKQDEYKQLWEDIGWEYSKEEGRFSFKPQNEFIIDFDLDCFTTSILGKLMAIPKDLLISKFREPLHPDYHYFFTSEEFVRCLIRKSEFTTMCFESGCCGGIRESHKIFDTVDYLFFDNEIGA